MDEKQKLIQLIEGLPEAKLAGALRAIRKIAGEQQSCAETETENSPPLQELLTGMVYSLSNTLYDLSIDAERKGEKVMAKRLEAYRKKVAETWDRYKAVKANEK